MDEKQANGKVALTDENRISWRDILGGKVMLKPQVAKQYRVLLLVFFLCVMYVGNILECERQEREIKQLNEKLMYQRMDYYTVKKKLNEEVSLEKVIEKLNRNRLDLEVSSTPPFTY